MNKKFIKQLFLFCGLIFCSFLLPVDLKINAEAQSSEIDLLLEKKKKDMYGSSELQVLGLL